MQQVLHGKIYTLRGGFINAIVAFVRKEHRDKMAGPERPRDNAAEFFPSAFLLDSLLRPPFTRIRVLP